MEIWNFNKNYDRNELSNNFLYSLSFQYNFPKYYNLHNLHKWIIDSIISSMIIIDIISSNLTATIPNEIPQGLVTSSVELNTFNPSLVTMKNTVLDLIKKSLLLIIFQMTGWSNTCIKGEHWHII